MGRELSESGVLDRAVLNRQIEEILDGLSAEPSLAAWMERPPEGFLCALNEGDVAKPAKHVCASSAWSWKISARLRRCP